MSVLYSSSRECVCTNASAPVETTSRSVVLQASTRTDINKVLTRLTLCRSRVAAPERCVTFLFTSQTRVPVSEAAAGRSPRARVPLEAVPERTQTPHGVNRTAAELMK